MTETTPSPPDTMGLSMLYHNARHPPKDPQTSFAGRTVLVTGANVGLGFESALKFAALGASRLILGIRSLQKGEDAKAQICQRTNYDPTNIVLYHLDMSAFDSVVEFSKVLTEKESILNIAVLNAGICSASYTQTPSGYETSLQVNVLSTALLSVLLLPLLHRTAIKTGQPSHLEFMSSIAHHGVDPTTLSTAATASILEQVSSRPFFNVSTQYNVNKLLLMYVAESVSSNSNPDTVIINTVCPGLCRTNLGRDFGLLATIPVWIFQRAFARTAEQGSRSVVSGVTLGPEAHGQFWTHDVFFKKADLLTSGEGRRLQEKVWAEIVVVLEERLGSLDRYFYA